MSYRPLPYSTAYAVDYIARDELYRIAHTLQATLEDGVTATLSFDYGPRRICLVWGGPLRGDAPLILHRAHWRWLEDTSNPTWWPYSQEQYDQDIRPIFDLALLAS